jgi:glycerol-3-phosphate O-acyltransferase/dihydroxyacetone phosphate acyltransferase
MIYRLLRWFTGIALHWFYSSIQIVGRERIPATGPVIIAASHHNALVDALIAGWITPRKLTITAKATLMDNVFLSWLLPIVGVVPLRRAADEQARNPNGRLDTTRNTQAFERVLNVLQQGEMVLIFPEGKSHSDPKLAPLKTGVARLALAARDTRNIHGLQIIPLGLSFEDKGKPGTAVLAEVGEPVLLDQTGNPGVEGLTSIVAARLAAVSLKRPQPSPDREAVKRAGRVRPLASPLAAWGELTHRYVINYARDLAMARSHTPDDPAMLTIVLALVLILLSYAFQFAILAILLNPVWAALYVATLPLGAYWAAFRHHPETDAG